MADTTWSRVDRLCVWLDENAVQGTPNAVPLLRALKIAEKYGEVAEAIHGAMGSNPRKGASHTWGDVHTKLDGLIETTTVALKTSTTDDENAVQGKSDVVPLLRVLKIGEEFGEVAEAILGVMGASHGKGASHMQEELHNELCDVILTAMVALASCTPDAQKVFEDRLEYITERSLNSGQTTHSSASA
ncbi:MazG-like family protein [Streptomyces rhizosphaericus]|uniref:MazG-like family protein n=1 Tax=Streptomyces rhizosphaericus TaxID=114699 RepID=UPI0028930827|nr:MazG-like family protein [Streptomyces rhizosphaericus]